MFFQIQMKIYCGFSEPFPPLRTFRMWKFPNATALKCNFFPKCIIFAKLCKCVCICEKIAQSIFFLLLYSALAEEVLTQVFHLTFSLWENLKKMKKIVQYNMFWHVYELYTIRILIFIHLTIGLVGSFKYLSFVSILWGVP